MSTEHLDPALEQCATRLEVSSQYRVLRAVPAPYSNFPEDGVPPDGKCVAIVDLETSGLSPDDDAIIELALMLVWLDGEANVLAHFGPLSWMEDPGVPLDPRITVITGLTNDDLAGKVINDVSVQGLLSRADVCVAHNAVFEVGWLERRYPWLAHMPWGCSLADINWLMAGCDGRSQTSLLAQHGWFSEAHRAAADVWSLFWLLNQRRRGVEPGPIRTHMQRLVEAVEADTVMVEARGAPIAKKDLLKARGYRWFALQKFWAKEMDQELLAHEQAWFFTNGLPAPTLRAISAHQRHRRT